MFCEKCGTQLPDNATACSICGAVINTEPTYAPAEQAYAPAEQTYAPAEQAYAPAEQTYAPAEQAYAPVEPTYDGGYYQDPNATYYANPEYAPNAAELSSLASGSLTMGILGLALCAVPILGIIFAKMGISKAGKYNSMATVPSGKAKTGKILGIIGLIFSIIWTIYWAVFAALMCAGIAAF